MLHAMLWTGLRQELKDISGHKYDTIKDFNKLRVALRQIEKDHKPTSSKPNTAKAATASSTDRSDFEELKGMVQQLQHTVTELQQQQEPEYKYRRGTYYRGNREEEDDGITDHHDRIGNNQSSRSLRHQNNKLYNMVSQGKMRRYTAGALDNQAIYRLD